QVFGHPWLLQGGEKMSKTKGNVIYADDLVDIFGVDATRYFVVHEMPYENDGVITWDLVAERVNTDLANTFGNLVNRTISMTNKYFGGIVADRGAAEEVDDDLKAVVTGAYAKVEDKMDELRAADALTEIFTVFKRLNKYIDETEPWKLAKDPDSQDRLSTVLYNLTEGIIMGTSLMAPFMPSTADKVAQMLNTSLRPFDSLDTFGLYPSGNKVTDSPVILFARLDKKEVAKKVEVIMEKQRAAARAEAEADAAAEEAEKQEKAAKKAEKEAAKAEKKAGKTAEKAVEKEEKAEVPVATYDDFCKLQFRVGEILECRAVEKSKKLLCSQVKIGDEVRQILSGIKAHYSPEEMVGKKVMVITNLAPRKMAGMLSEGMLLCAEDAEGNLALMTPDKDMPSGSEIC
ncbi:MAG: methionine--tRNA ligase subunit beta, partial [Lachnospiraceae bacterium]|nr:methionine--tRNA ligase subunit beta [Lachnospiraceae bacterium]